MRQLPASLLILLIGCASTKRPTPAAERVPDSKPEARADAPVPDNCVIAAQSLDPPALHPDLSKVAPQYFHAPHRGGFDAYAGGNIFPWFDIYSLDTLLVSPPNSRIAASTHASLFPVSNKGELGVLDRNDTTTTWTGHHLYPEEAIEGDAGVRWVLARSGTTWRVVELDASNAPTVHDLGVDETTWDVRLALTADGRLAVAWLERIDGLLRVRLAFDLDVSGAFVIDEVKLPDRVAELSHRTTVNLALTSDGPDGLAVAWRPLFDPSYTDFGDRSTPPSTPAAAEVRWLAVKGDGTPSVVHRHRTVAHPLGFVTGVGPWALHGNGMKAATYEGRGLFVWLDDEVVYGARASGDSVFALTERGGAPLIAFRDRQEQLELLLLDSSPRIRRMRLQCSDRIDR